MNKQRRAFTLIELLVTISLLIILMAVVVVNMAGVRRNSRDGRRLADVDLLLNAVTHYTLQKGTTAITEGSCSVTVRPGGLSSGSGVGCTGADGTSFGKMNLRQAQVQTVVSMRKYTDFSIIDALRAAGDLAVGADDPLNTDKDHTDSNQPDYLLLRCCQNAKQSLLTSAPVFAVWTALERTPTTIEKNNTNQYCGARNLQPGSNQVYDMGISETERPYFESNGVAKGNAALQKMVTTDVPCCGGSSPTPSPTGLIP